MIPFARLCSLLCLCTLLLVGSIAAADQHKHKQGKGHHKVQGHQKIVVPEKGPKLIVVQEDYFPDDWWKAIHTRVYQGSFKVPPGHRPGPGMCRLWFPDLPPGHQPAPIPCQRFRRDPKAYIVYGERAYDPRYDWAAADQNILRTLPHTLLDIMLDRSL
jgi:hypothetical protein